MRTVRIGEAEFGAEALGLLVGPCVIESREHCLRMAESIRDVVAAHGLPWVFKASYDKANRTSASSYRGPGPDEGLRILEEVRREVGVAVITDIHERGQAAEAAQAVDALQIPAFLCRQTDLLLAAAATGKPVNVKKGQFLAPWDMGKVVEKLASADGGGVMITERGTSFGYNNLVVDFKGLAMMRSFGCPVVLDVTHSLQLPAAEGARTGGQPEFAEPLAAAGVAMGVDVLFLEVHDDPPRALSDATTQLPLEALDALLGKVRRVRAAVQERSS